ncbi:ADP-ribosylglycohydrolase family protein [Deinococcus ficus]|nr:ADP-ribosylglycohydrolase family protein [Deinococcus ficus]
MTRRLTILFGLTAADALAAPEAAHPADPAAQDGLNVGDAGRDTQMVLATLDGYRKRNVLRGLVEWAWSAPSDIDVQTQRALQREVPWGGMLTWMESGGQPAGSSGLNGVPGALIAGATGEFLLHEAVYITALTHPDPRNLYASAFLAALLEELTLRGEPGAHDRAWTRASHVNLTAITETRGLHPENHDETLKAKHLIRRRSDEAREQVHARIEAGLRGEVAPLAASVLDTLQSVVAHGRAGTFIDGVQAAIRTSPDSAALTGAVLTARGLTVPPTLIPELRVGHTWKAWAREWSCEERYPAIVPASGEPQS